MLSSVVTAEMMSGVLNEVLGLCPVVIPAAITYVAARKGIGFVFGVIRRA